MDLSASFIAETASSLQGTAPAASGEKPLDADLTLKNKHNLDATSKLTPKPVVDISEASLAEGFSWKPKQPPPPGQFSGTPRHSGIPQLGDIKKSTPIVETYRPLYQVSTPEAKIDVPPPILPDRTVQLPELCLSEYSSVSKHFSSPQESLTHNSSGGPRPGLRPSAEEHNAAHTAGSIPTSSPPELDTSPGILLRQQLNRDLALPQNDISSECPRSHGLVGPDTYETTQKPCLELHRVDVARSTAQRTPIYATAPDRVSHYGSPTSTCGDLEAPARHTPARRGFLLDGKSKSHYGSGISCIPHDSAGFPHQRSRSRTSNISRKRSSVNKDRYKPQPERKRTAMIEVARHWNECMKIAEEEKLQAGQEIERLQVELRRRNAELLKSRAMLKDGEAKTHDLKVRSENAEERLQQVQVENQGLTDQVATLQDQTSKANERVASFADKLRLYKSKLNEAIEEQQRLFNISGKSYKDALDEMRKWSEERKSEIDAVSRTLDDSQARQHEMKTQLQDIRRAMELESQEKTNTILELQQQVRDQELNLTLERGVNMNLQQQLDSQNGFEHMEQLLVEKLDSLVQLYATKDDRLRLDMDDEQPLSDQISLILNHVSSLHESSSQPNLEPMFQAVQENIISHLLPVILTIVNKFDDAGQFIGSLQRELQSAFMAFDKKMCSALDQHETTLGRMGPDERLMEYVEKISDDMKHSRESHDRLEQRLEAYAQDERAAYEAHQAEHAGLVEQLQQREFKINQLECQFQASTENYTRDVETMRAKIQDQDEASKNELQALGDKLRQRLKEEFDQERNLSEQSLQESKAVNKALATELEEARKRLASAGDVNNLRQSLQEEQKTSMKLSEKIHELEHEAQDRNATRSRWQEDIQEIDSLRTKIKSIFERVPGLEAFRAKLEHIEQLNSHITSTSEYLQSERNWIHEQLRVGVEAKPAETGPADTKFVASDGVNDEAAKPKDAQTDRIQVSTGLCELDPSMLENESIQRRVMVHSPCVDPNSPCPPPSVEQEQKRRREANKPRPILKLRRTRVVESNENKESVLRVAHNHSQYNRPVLGGISSAASQKGFQVSDSSILTTSEQVVQQIRAGLVQRKRPSRSWDFPTVADFERLQQSAQDWEKTDAGVKVEMGDASEQVTKKAKTLNDTSRSIMVEASNRGRGVEASQDAALGRRPITRTYSQQMGM